MVLSKPPGPLQQLPLQKINSCNALERLRWPLMTVAGQYVISERPPVAQKLLRGP